MAITIEEANGSAAIACARQLIAEYGQSLGIDLGFQGFAAELVGLPGEYARPGGRLLLARHEGAIAGCVAMRKLDEFSCEMKRLYVMPAHRAVGAAQQLVERVIAEARESGYQRMVLDTLPTMSGAQRLYERIGFRDVPAYRHNPIAGTRYLGLDLSTAPTINGAGAQT